MSEEDLGAALAASERRTARAEEEARVARRERVEAVESAARLRQALRTFAEAGENSDNDEGEDENDDDVRAECVSEAPATRSAGGHDDTARSISTNDDRDDERDVDRDDERDDDRDDDRAVRSRRSETESLRAKLSAALQSARRARSDAEAAAERVAALTRTNDDFRARLDEANAATALARRQVAETSASLRREPDPKPAPRLDETESSRDADEAAATRAAVAAMEATVARLASTLRARERELDDTRAAVATLVRERGERERAFRAARVGGGARRETRAENARRDETHATVAPAKARAARTPARRNRADGPVSRERVLTRTNDRGYE